MERKLVEELLTGKGTHVAPATALEGLDWRQAGERPEGAAHSIYQILNHAIYWQDQYLLRLQHRKAVGPRNGEDEWPGPPAPESPEAWLRAVNHFEGGVGSALALARGNLGERLVHWEDGRTRFEALCFLASHNSYHLGQIVQLRRMLGAWPPSRVEATT